MSINRKEKAKLEEKEAYNLKEISKAQSINFSIKTKRIFF